VTTTELLDVRRPDVEAWLTERAVDWKFEPDFPLERIDQKLSLANQARLEPLDHEVVDRYASDMKRGDKFPPLLVLDPGGKGKKRLLGGNHRLFAHRIAGHETAPVYLVKAEPEMAMRLTYEDNRRHGLPPSDMERIVQAIQLTETGWTLEAASACVGVSAARVSQERTMVKAARRAKALGVDEQAFKSLQKWSRYHLGRLRSDPVFIEAANLVIKAKLGTEEVKAFVTRLMEAKSDNDAMQMIGIEEEGLQNRIQKSGGGKIRGKRTPRGVLLTAMRDIRNRDPEAIVSSTPNEARPGLRKEVDAAIEHLVAVRKALG
jgi:ParB-like chromosome segregation protein Spo0J